jgi:hypothetical protein
MTTSSTNTQAGKCPLCDGTATVAPALEPLGTASVICKRCGKFQIEAPELWAHSETERHLVSGLTREYCERHHERLLIPRDEKRREELKRLAPNDRDVQGKVRRLLFALDRMSEYPGHRVECLRSTDYPLAYCRNDEEFDFFFRYLNEGPLIRNFTCSSSGWTAEVSAEGCAAIDAYKTPSMETDKVFVAMWFDEEMGPAYAQGIKPAIEDDCGYRAIKIDLKESVGDIVDEIIAEIRESRFVVADFTGQRQGVYYEAGYARGMGLPVIWTCRKDDLGNLHFDTRQ